MQQYRFNYPLFIGLVIGTLVCSTAVYGLWRFQIGRKSGWLLAEAEKAGTAGDHREAVKRYSEYLTIDPKNEDIQIKRAVESLKLTKSNDLKPGDMGDALRVLESTTRVSALANNPEMKTLRRGLAEIYGQENFGRYQDALEHLDYLGQEDADVQALRATYFARSGDFNKAVELSYKLVGYDPATDEFDDKKAIAPGHVELYSNLAVTLRTKQDKPQLADRVMDQLVATNPESAEAHLARGRYHLSIENSDEARAEFDEAYKLKPEDANVLLAMADISARDEENDRAADYIAMGKKLFPQDVRFYRAAGAIQMQQKEFGQAVAEVDEGIEKVNTNDKLTLRGFKVEILLNKNDLKAAQLALEDMERSANVNPFLVDYFRARIMMAGEKWPQAKSLLSMLRPRMAELTNGQTSEIDAFLGLCYEKMHQFDMATKSYETAVAQNPNYPAALAGLERVNMMRGVKPQSGKDDEWSKKYADFLKQPKAERNTAELEAMLVKFGDEQKWDEVTKKTRLAQIKLLGEDFESARKLLVEARKLAPENIAVWRMLIQLVRQDEKLGPQKALELQAQAVKKFGDRPSLRIEKADILIAMNVGKPSKDELKTELAGLADGIDAWTDEQKAELWGGLAGRFLNLGLSDEARQYLSLAADVRPDDLPTRVTLFSLALEANDDAGMKDAQDKILKIVGSTDDSQWLYADARRKLSLVRRGQLDRKAIEEIRPLVNRALEQRKDWHELYVLNAELEVEAGNLGKALESFNRAQELGRPYPAATAQHIKLLAYTGRVKQAGDLLERIPQPLRFTYLGQLYPEILFRTNRVEEALKEASDAVKANSANPQSHFLYSQLLARSAQPKPPTAAAPGTPAPDPATQANAPNKEVMAQAIQEMRKAIELQPEFPEAWLTLISYYGLLKDDEQAQAVLREAQLSLSGDNLQAFLARSYEALGRWFDAETMYRALFESAPDDLARAQQLAAFYLGNIYRLPDRNTKATPLINKILRAGAEKKIQPNDPALFWARRMGAKMLAQSKDYQNLLKAEKLLASNSQNGELTIEDKLTMAELLADRPEPESRQKAIQLLEDVAKVQSLSEEDEVTLGKLYFLTGGDWRKYATQMEKAAALYPNSLAARVPYVTNLINRGDEESLNKAVVQVNNMRRIAPNHSATFELAVRLASKLGKQPVARANLLKSVPDLAKIQTLTDQDRQVLGTIAGLLIELGDLDTAERIYRKVAELDPTQNITLANFLGMHRGVDKCFELLNQIYTPERIPLVAQVGLVVVRKQREKVGDKFDAQIQSWLETGLNENPESITLLMDQADLYDIQKRYDEAAAVYKKLLANKDLTGIRRAIVLNNLSFLVALAGSSAKVSVDPLKLVDEAIFIMGPNSDILDTRAVVYISLKRYPEAIEDLELSVTDNPTASKYFHKAHAHLLAGQNREAMDAWTKAEALGLNRDALTLIELPLLDQLKGRIDQLRGGSVTRAELRPAG